MDTLFRDRTDAGRQLAAALHAYAHAPDLLVLALPRGGVPVAYEVAKALHAPLDVLVVRKLGAPHEPEFAMGAIASGGVLHLEDDVVRALGVSEAALAATIARERAELARREAAYRGARAPLPVEGRSVIVVDDGIATGASMHAALAALRARGPARVIVAAPVCAHDARTGFAGEADALVSVIEPRGFMGIGQFYADFTQTSDDTVRACLDARRDECARGTSAAAPEDGSPSA